jgi:hypothetical protein
MSGPTLYDDDILLWSEQQAAAIRKLGATARNLPNELDIENVAEEIESVGRSELAAVKSYLRLILSHLTKLAVEANSQAAAHWRIEIAGFHSDMMDRYAPSMRQRIDLEDIWRSTRERLMLTDDVARRQRIVDLPEHCPFSIDDFIAERIDSLALLERLRAGAIRGG